MDDENSGIFWYFAGFVIVSVVVYSIFYTIFREWGVSGGKVPLWLSKAVLFIALLASLFGGVYNWAIDVGWTSEDSEYGVLIFWFLPSLICGIGLAAAEHVERTLVSIKAKIK